MRYLLIVLIWIFSAGQLQAAEITSLDFAVGYYLEVDAKGAVYSLELPEEVYRTVKSADLSDVRVFNGAGEIVPHDLRIVKADETILHDRGTIPFFPLFQESASSDPAEFSLQVSRNTAGAIVNIQSDSAADADDRKITGYLLDLSSLKEAASELKFYWQKDIDSSVFTVNIEQSSDLVHWMPLVQKATLADLQFGGQQVERRTVNLPQQPLQYLKLTWQEPRWPLRLTKIDSFTRSVETHGNQQWISLSNGIIQKKNDRLTVEYKTDYRFPAGSVQIRFPETNSIAGLSVQSRPDGDTEWRTQCEQVFHDLSFQDTVIQNEPCEFPPTADPLWRVVVKQDGAGLRSGNRNLILQLGWQPSELLFIGRGNPPYLLAFGSGKLAREENIPGDGMIILQTVQMKSPTGVVSPAKLGKRVSLGGDLALQSPVKPPPWKKLSLWAVLLLGIGLLAFMVRNLTKEMKAAEEKRVSEER
jgi:hypothetical protein